MRDVWKAAANCVRAGLNADCSREVCLKAGLLIAGPANRETVLGAARAKDLMESMMRRYVRVWSWRMVFDVLMKLQAPDGNFFKVGRPLLARPS